VGPAYLWLIVTAKVTPEANPLNDKIPPTTNNVNKS
jgi:hypothetical protein